jgi:hypothetical protein
MAAEHIRMAASHRIRAEPGSARQVFGAAHTTAVSRTMHRRFASTEAPT